MYIFAIVLSQIPVFVEKRCKLEPVAIAITSPFGDKARCAKFANGLYFPEINKCGSSPFSNSTGTKWSLLIKKLFLKICNMQLFAKQNFTTERRIL